jgi:hypothetical protein
MKFAIALAVGLALGPVGAIADDAAAPADHKGACKADIQKFCGSVEHTRDKMHACLTGHQADLSDTCKQRMAAWAANKAAPAAN